MLFLDAVHFLKYVNQNCFLKTMSQSKIPRRTRCIFETPNGKWRLVSKNAINATETCLLLINNIIDFDTVTCACMTIRDEMSNLEIFNIKATKEML